MYNFFNCLPLLREVARSDGGIMKHNKNLTTYARELRKNMTK